MRLDGTAVSHLWSNEIDLELDLTKFEVKPIRFRVVAYRNGQALRRFEHVVECPPVVFIAARGSGQTQFLSEAFAGGLGNRGRSVLKQIRDQLGVSRFDLPAIAVDYAAVGVGLDPGSNIAPGNFPQIYRSSVSIGIQQAKLAILRVLTSCRDTHLVLFGYSQGAQVIGDAFAQLDANVRRSIRRVILFADAKYRAGDPRVTYLPPTRPLAGSGIKGARELFPPDDDATIESWCWDQDAICQRPPHGQKFHGSIYNGFEGEAAEMAVADLRPFFVQRSRKT